MSPFLPQLATLHFLDLVETYSGYISGALSSVLAIAFAGSTESDKYTILGLDKENSCYSNRVFLLSLLFVYLLLHNGAHGILSVFFFFINFSKRHLEGIQLIFFSKN